ncbi:hypothetical protein TNCV_3707111 [Trichonephila clavipes]|nr:hypothetical protein TNCV_3707111 [Trichonephila clavipes]
MINSGLADNMSVFSVGRSWNFEIQHGVPYNHPESIDSVFCRQSWGQDRCEQQCCNMTNHNPGRLHFDLYQTCWLAFLHPTRGTSATCRQAATIKCNLSMRNLHVFCVNSLIGDKEFEDSSKPGLNQHEGLY